MGADKHERDRKEKLPPFVMALKSTMSTPAWRAMSHGARSLYYALKWRYNHKSCNSGRLFLSQRDAAKQIGSHHNEIARWFRELQHYGFIVQMSPGSLGVEGRGKAPHWRLTEAGYMRDMPTKEFERWDGQKFKDEKTESRAPFPARGVPENQHGSVPENQPLDRKSVLESPHIQTSEGVPEKAHIITQPLISHSSRPPSASPYLVAATERKDEARAQRAPKGAQASERVRAGGR